MKTIHFVFLLFGTTLCVSRADAQWVQRYGPSSGSLEVIAVGGPNQSGRRLLVPQEYPMIQTAIDSAVHGDTVLVSEGTYYENIDFRGKTIVVASYMILDDDTTHRNHTVINGNQPSDTTKGSVVSFVSGEDTMSVIYGFTITGGTGTISIDNSRVGGGVFCYASAARIAHNKIIGNVITYSGLARGGGIGTFPFGNNFYTVIDSNVIQMNSCVGDQNAQGGGIYMPHGRIEGNVIHGNSCQGGGHALGGGIHGASDLNVERHLYIAENLVENNKSLCTSVGGYGGGIDIYGGIVVYMIDNAITNNYATDVSAPFGGGIRLRYTAQPSTIRGNTISHNSAGPLGGGGGIGLAGTRGITVSENKFHGNRSSYGGGIADNLSSETVIQGNEFIGNDADTSGGAIYSLQSDLTVDKNLIKKNTASVGGGVMCTVGNHTIANNIIIENQADWGGGVFCAQIPSQDFLTYIVSNTVSGNTAAAAGGIVLFDAPAVLINSIVWGNSAPFAQEIQAQGGTIDVAHCDIRFGRDSIVVTQGGILRWVTGNITSNPHYLDTTMQLADSSPCIGAAIDSIEIGGIWYHAPRVSFYGVTRPTPDTSRPDIGACEHLRGHPTTGVGEQISALPGRVVLDQNYPNPFNPSTTIRFELPTSNEVRLTVFDLLGREVSVLVNERREAGYHSVEFNASNLSSGVYFYRMQAGDFVQTRKLLLIR